MDNNREYRTQFLQGDNAESVSPHRCRVSHEQTANVELLDAYSRAVITAIDSIGLAVGVISVNPRGPSGQSSLREADIIAAIDGESVTSVDDIHRHLGCIPIGVSVTLTVIRGRARSELQIFPAEVETFQ